MAIKYRLKALLNADSGLVRAVSGAAYRAFIRSSLVYAVRYRPHMDDRQYIIRLYKKRFGVEPNLDRPQNFNEKSNWRKLNDRRDIYTDMVDKLKLKRVVRDSCGDGYTIPLLGEWDDPADIDIDRLPDKFVLKPNHAGGIIVCRDKATFDAGKAVSELKAALKLDYYHKSREWPYKNVERRILCEKYMGENLTDYKNYCFNGKLMYTLVWMNRSREDGRKPEAYFCGMFDRDWKKTDMELDYPSMMDEAVQKPACYDEMVAVAEKLSAGIPFVRVDCFIIENRVYVGEMTFFPWGGFQKFKDERWNMRLGELEKLPGIDYIG